MQFFPNNTLTNYTTRLHTRLELGEPGSWEAGLAEIHYPHTWKNVFEPRMDPERINPELLEDTDPLYPPHRDDYSISAFPLLNQYLHDNHPLEPGHYKKVSDVVKIYDRRLSQFAKFTWDRSQSRVRIHVHQDKRIILTDALARLWHIEKDLNAFMKDGGKTFEGKRVDDVFPDIAHMYVYCDLVNHQLVGDSRVPLLRIVPLTGRAGENVTTVYENIQYVPVRGGPVQNIEVDIRDDTGRPISFRYGRVVVSLHLRKARSQYFQP